MIKIILALFISFAYAAELLETKDETIEKTPISGFDQLSSDTFYCIMTFLSAEKVLSLKILNRGIYRKVKSIWPKMELSTIVDIYHHRLIDFSHIVTINGTNYLPSHMLTFTRAQLSCLREFSLSCSSIHNLQAMIDLLPRDSLTSLKLHLLGPPCQLISKIDFPKLIHLELNLDISLNYDTFSFLPNSMRVFKISNINMDDIMSSSLAVTLKIMDKLEDLSLSGCTIPKSGFSTILENLPASLKSLDIHHIRLSDLYMWLSEAGLKRLKEMKCLQKIDFQGVSNEFALGIILNLLECVTSIECSVNREVVNAFQQRSSRLINVKKINYFWMQLPKLLSSIQEIFPYLDENIKKEFDSVEL